MGQNWLCNVTTVTDLFSYCCHNTPRHVRTVCSIPRAYVPSYSVTTIPRSRTGLHPFSYIHIKLCNYSSISQLQRLFTKAAVGVRPWMSKYIKTMNVKMYPIFCLFWLHEDIYIYILPKWIRNVTKGTQYRVLKDRKGLFQYPITYRAAHSVLNPPNFVPICSYSA